MLRKQRRSDRPFNHRFLASALIGTLILLFVFLTSASAAADERSFIWRVTSDTTTAYLLGSVHFFKKELYPLNKIIEQAFESSDSLVVEVDIASLAPDDMKSSVLKGAMHDKGVPLSKRLTKDTYERTQKKLYDFGIDITSFDMFKPSFIALTLTGLELNKLGFEPEHGIDIHFIRKARGKKAIIELESFEMQADLFNSFSDEEQELLLIYTLNDLALFSTQIDKLVSSWVRGDTIKMHTLLTQSIKDRPDLLSIYEKLIDDRNTNMAHKIMELLRKEGTYFIVVGAAHLTGEKGIISLLEKRGFKADQL